MTAGVCNITIEQGADFLLNLLFRDLDENLIDLTGWTAEMMIRTVVDSPSPLVSLSSSNGITLGGTAGTILIELTGAMTSALCAGTGVYDLKMVDPDEIPYRLIEGAVTIVGAVTR